MKCRHDDCDGQIIEDDKNYDPPYICNKCDQSYNLISLCDCGAPLTDDEFEGMQCADCAMHEKLLGDSLIDCEDDIEI